MRYHTFIGTLVLVYNSIWELKYNTKHPNTVCINLNQTESELMHRGKTTLRYVYTVYVQYGSYKYVKADVAFD